MESSFVSGELPVVAGIGRVARTSGAARPLSLPSFRCLPHDWAGYACALVEANFSGPNYTIGIEEELMILDAESLDLVNAIEPLLADTDSEQVKPELMESVLEIATQPCGDIREAGAELRGLRRQVAEIASKRDLTIGSAGTHPFALWEDQRIVQRERYRGLVSDLGFVARQELLFGQHVHVGLDDREKAIHVANGMRVHLPVLLALSASSPFWRGDATGLASTRTPIFRAFPRVGIPPRYEDWTDYEASIAFMTQSGAIEDYTFLWYDVRPHPNLGTVEIRVMDGQTRIEHTLGLAALIQAMVKELAEHFEAGKRLTRYPHQMLDENKWLAARHGLDGELVDLPSRSRVPTRELAQRLLDRLRGHAEELGSATELAGIEDLLANGNGAARQRVVYDANHDLREVMAEIVAATVPQPA
jgi:carboxylate-amine ligase